MPADPTRLEALVPYDFDADLPDDLSFIAAGRTYTMRLVGPDVLAKYEDEEDPETAADAIERLIARVSDFLVAGDKEPWEAAVKADEVPYRTMAAIATWAWEIQTGRPTMPQSPSGTGRGETEATSTVAAARSARAAVRSQRRGRR